MFFRNSNSRTKSPECYVIYILHRSLIYRDEIYKLRRYEPIVKQYVLNILNIMCV